MEINYKEIIGIITIFLVLLGQFFYVRSILQGETKPHIYTNIIWVILMRIGFFLQFNNGASAGSWSLGLLALTDICILFLAFKYCTSDITKIDTILFILALLCIPIYIYFENQLFSLISIICITIFGDIPTIRKTFNAPFSENFTSWNLSILRTLLSIFAINQYNIYTLFYPIVLIIIALILVIGMYYKRMEYRRIKIAS